MSTERLRPAPKQFIHLRVHSAYSLLEGALPISKIVDFATHNGAPAIAITDASNLFGALEFAQKASKAGVQPLIGCQLSVDFGDKASLPQVSGVKKELPSFPTMVFLAANAQGYTNLVEIVSRSFMETPTGDPISVKSEWLREHGAGIIALTGGVAGPIDSIIATSPDVALARLQVLEACFGDRLYVEVQRCQGYDK